MNHDLTHIDEAEHGTIKSFAVVWIILLVFTAFEVLLAYKQVNPVIMLTILVVAIAAGIGAFVLHLRGKARGDVFGLLVACAQRARNLDPSRKAQRALVNHRQQRGTH